MSAWRSVPPSDAPPRGWRAGRALSWLRWAIIAALLVLTLAEPVDGRTGLPVWSLVLAFAAYNLVVELARRRVHLLRGFALVPWLDLPVVAGLCALDRGPDGLTFALFFLAVVSAAATMSPWATALYVAAVALTVAAIVPVFPWWTRDARSMRELGGRLIVLGIVGVGTALLAQASRERAAQRAELERLRSGFIATVSHELRTPLTAARAGLGMLGLSLGERLTTDEGALLANVRRNVERLGLYIDDLVALNQLEAGALRLNRAPIDLRTVVAGATAAVTPLLEQQGQRLELALPEPLPVEGDARRLEQVVADLLALAHRRAPRGARIAVVGRQMDGTVALAVSDDGPGLSREELARVLGRAGRPGVGGDRGELGLAVARRIVALHGGRLRAASRPERGATFSITLPRRAGGSGGSALPPRVVPA